MGETVTFPKIGGGEIKARIVGPVFYDPEGAKQDV
jgi:sarcosine oxidase, subunit alpha